MMTALKMIDARLAGFCSRICADIYVHVFEVT